VLMQMLYSQNLRLAFLQKRLVRNALLLANGVLERAFHNDPAISRRGLRADFKIGQRAVPPVPGRGIGPEQRAEKNCRGE